MKRLVALGLLLIMACRSVPKGMPDYDGFPPPVKSEDIRIFIHNLSSSNVTVYLLRPGNGNKRRLATVTSQDVNQKLDKSYVDSDGCIQVFTHEIGDAFNRNDWLSPSTCWQRGTVFDLVIGSYHEFNVLSLMPAEAK